MNDGFTHLDDKGRARMVDVGDKPTTSRRAVARGSITMQPEVRDAILEGKLPKGDVLAVARIAGIQATKETSRLIPLCHPLPIDAVEVHLEAEGDRGLAVETTVVTHGKTGVEMEALTGCTVALLAVYDMCKARDRAMEIGPVRLIHKEGGKSGTWTRESTATDDP